MPFPLTNFLVAALAAGGLAGGVSAAGTPTSSPRAAAVRAEQAQELELRSDIVALTATEQHLRSTLATRLAASSHAPADPVEPGAPATDRGGPSPAPPTETTGPSRDRAVEPTTSPASPGGTWSGPSGGDTAPAPATTEPTEGTGPGTPTSEPPETSVPTTTSPAAGGREDGAGDD